MYVQDIKMNGGRTHRFEKQDTQANKRTALLREEVEVPYQIVWVLNNIQSSPATIRSTRVRRICR